MPIEYIAIWIPFVAIVAGAKIVLTAMRNHQQYKLAQLEAKRGPAAGVSDERTAILEDRIAVLERIVTDKSYDVAHQIEALRGNVAIEQLKREKDTI